MTGTENSNRFRIISNGDESQNGASSELYSVLKNAQSDEVAENMSELSETILGNEKENAKSMLEKLWKLKSTLNKSENHSQIEELIDHYQSKLDVLRKKEEYITKTSQKSKKLFEEKQEKEEQITSMTSQINDYSDQINKLTQKRRQLLVERDKLTGAEKELTNELDSNQERIVAGLYDIITAGKVTPSTSPTPRPARSASHAQKQPSGQTPPYDKLIAAC
jgi:ABC-type transporter Mla subunit MlaD